VRILLTGKTGQVGWELARALSPVGNVVALGHVDLDLARPDDIVAHVRDVKPDVIINSAAYTAVDRAESEPDLAMAVNAKAPGVLAEEAAILGALLVHYSTDYVFDGSNTQPYTEEDAPNPLSVYGHSKLAGERAIEASGCRYLTLRTSWVYASRGKNFLLTILRVARERPELRVVDDQRGAPTWARHIAEATVELLSSPDPPIGVYHLTASGVTTWCGFAREIVRIAGLDTPVRAIATADYPTPAVRPRNSVFNTAKIARVAGVVLPEWSAGARACMAETDRAGGAP
jgi:dTDP-4-dehydrorhamnose reductase